MYLPFFWFFAQYNGDCREGKWILVVNLINMLVLAKQGI